MKTFKDILSKSKLITEGIGITAIKTKNPSYVIVKWNGPYMDDIYHDINGAGAAENFIASFIIDRQMYSVVENFEVVVDKLTKHYVKHGEDQSDIDYMLPKIV